MNRFLKSIIGTFVIVKAINFAIGIENNEIKGNILELDPKAEGGEGILVVNKATEFGVQKPYIKYALFQENRNTCFNVKAVLYKGNKLKAKGWAIMKDDVYDVYTYWRDNTLLLLAFRYGEPEFRSKYKYFMNRTNGWEEVDGEIFSAERSGIISVENLTKLLKWIEEKNAPQPEKLKRKDTTRRTIILVGVVLGVVAVLLLVALLLFLKR